MPLIARLTTALACITLTACAARVTLAPGDTATRVEIASPVMVPSCTSMLDASVAMDTCRFIDATTGQAITSAVRLSGLSAEDDVQSVPVIILQAPQDATGFAGSFDNGRGKQGRMLVTSALAVVPVDSTTSIVAEPGTQLVTLQLPGDAGVDTYAMTISYQAASTRLKGMAAAKVTASGTTYYAPLLPCNTGFDTLPPIPIPGATTSVIDTSSMAASFTSCPGKTYTYTSVPPKSVAVTVQEYYNATLDHYFVTWVPAEIAALDGGNVRGWQRTGQSFNAWLTPEANTSPVCRYYMPPAFGDSHFFGRGTRECIDTGARNPAFVLEDPAFMYMTLPIAGACTPGTRPVYRAFSNRSDANHRYMTGAALRDAMTARGWIAEGDGPDLIVMCAPL